MSRDVLGIFMKSPVPGKCKTRLCPPLTGIQAASLYKAFCQDVLAMAQKTAKDVRLIYDSSPDFPTPHWANPNNPYFQQTGSNLGSRLQHAFNVLFSEGYSRVVMIGTDAPTLSHETIQTAFDLLTHNDAVFGPATDGGYYLVGLSKPNPTLFDGIPWSTNQVMAVTRQRLDQLKVSAGFLPAHGDVDTEEDLVRLGDKLKHAPATLASATRLALSRLDSLTR